MGNGEEGGKVPGEYLVFVGYGEWAVFELLGSVEPVDFDERPDEEGRGLLVRSSASSRTVSTE